LPAEFSWAFGPGRAKIWEKQRDIFAVWTVLKRKNFLHPPFFLQNNNGIEQKKIDGKDDYRPPGIGSDHNPDADKNIS
jgi:hypothetical protein